PHLSSFCSILSLQPRSTLFPYTTLFRSGHSFDCLCHCLFNRKSRCDAVRNRADHSLVNPDCKWHVLPEFRPHFWSDHASHLCDRDRKSTRLNSSHVSISYAVFCLKKKKY